MMWSAYNQDRRLVSRDYLGAKRDRLMNNLSFYGIRLNNDVVTICCVKDLFIQICCALDDVGTVNIITAVFQSVKLLNHNTNSGEIS
jgi:hypothetical protein